MKPIGRLTGWFRGKPLRSRLAVLTAAAVAVAIAVAAAACWFLVRDTLYQQVRTNLADAPQPVPPGRDQPGQFEPRAYCGTTADEALAMVPASTDRYHQNKWDTQVMTSAQVCFPLGSTRALDSKPSDLDNPGTLSHPGYREGEYTDGTPAMIRLLPATVDGKRAVLLTATPIKNVQDSLNSLALLMAGVAGLGVVGAGIAGRVVARSALKPVDQLTDVVEHIARTEEVGTTIPVNGKDEIARLATSFNSMSTALANSRERQTRLIADAGHELRTPLTSLRTNVDLLIRSDAQGRALPAETRARMLGNMKAQMQELTVLIGDLLQLSRPDTPNPEAVRTVVPFHETVGRALERGRLRGPSLTFETDVRPWYVHGDPAALERAVINLLDNAVKYSPPAGTIEVSLRDGRLTVRDHGPGIPAEELPYVFDRFWRSPSSRQLPGSGLGLSIVAQTVRDTGGQVSLGPAPHGGPGAQAVVVLPGEPAEPR
ncbi:two-component system sensor histidine kinase MprB [Kitasatospora sp. SolWspMP-SS2h]|uniref:sensor histidine kinase n=1 Tax=Kitasatospora sp. SolWspMP-SS2h TaxID=1305729 RepID=UPI000DB922B9|nr:HAMP domain-containing sensor histidine kinase [Kitasatospora sp. SolWspMP-SS2h]RAJ39801.1 two-component system sensor histidine kinase MprB [Kitasatospora sp. SolWspMP-SS2h]